MTPLNFSTPGLDLIETPKFFECRLQLAIGCGGLRVLKRHLAGLSGSPSEPNQHIRDLVIRNAGHLFPAVTRDDRLNRRRQPLEIDTTVGKKVRKLPSLRVILIADIGKATGRELVRRMEALC